MHNFGIRSLGRSTTTLIRPRMTAKPTDRPEETKSAHFPTSSTVCTWKRSDADRPIRCGFWLRCVLCLYVFTSSTSLFVTSPPGYTSVTEAISRHEEW